MKQFPHTAEGEHQLFKEVIGDLCGTPIMGIEIGCLNGASAHTILKANNNVALVSIDAFSYEKAMELNKEFSNRYRIKKAYSWDVVCDFQNESQDFIFIDGDHTKPGVALDCTLYIPKLKPDGLLFMHDCRMGREGGAPFHTGSSEVAQNILFNNPQWEVVAEAFSLACFRRV
jgi:predicted O-methyltransferase YrrM